LYHKDVLHVKPKAGIIVRVRGEAREDEEIIATAVSQESGI
jgi:hypothetical protein